MSHAILRSSDNCTPTLDLDEAELFLLRIRTKAQILGDAQNNLAVRTGVHGRVHVHVLGGHLRGPYRLTVIDLLSDNVNAAYFLFATGAQCQIITRCRMFIILLIERSIHNWTSSKDRSLSWIRPVRMA
jgi:hypothetical protein